MSIGSEEEELKIHYVSAINGHNKVRSSKFGERNQGGGKKSTLTTTVTIIRTSTRFLA